MRWGDRSSERKKHTVPVPPKVLAAEKDEAASVELWDSSWDRCLPKSGDH
jgi:hypothetical protein